MRCSKEDLACLLGVKKGTLINIEKNKQLEMRLEKKGYKLLGKEKAGRNVYYTLEQTNPEKEIYSNMVKYIFNSDKEDEFAEYFILRTENEGIPLGKKDIAEEIKLSTNTVSKFDDKMLKAKIISRDKFFYFCIERTKDEKTGALKVLVRECDEQEHNNFWKNTAYVKAFSDLQSRYVRGEITLNELQIASAGVGSTIAILENKYYYKVKKYKTNKNNQLYKDLRNLVIELYTDEDVEIEIPLVE